MLFLKKEEEAHNETKAAFWFRYDSLLGAMAAVSQERGTRLQTLSGGSAPLHHRMTPEGMVHEVRKKARRIEETMLCDYWYRDRALVAKVIEECVDAANYALFLGALCKMLEDEMYEGGRPEGEDG